MSSSKTALQWPPLKFSSGTPHTTQPDTSLRLLPGLLEGGARSLRCCRGRRGLCGPGPGGKTQASPAVMSHLGPVHWRLTKQRLPTVAIPGDAADDLSLRILFCRPARGAAFNLLAGSCSKHVYSASSKPPINGEGVRDLHLCPLPPAPALPLAEPAGPPDSVCPQRSFFFSSRTQLGQKAMVYTTH